MRHSDRVKLHFGPYRKPRYKRGQKVFCLRMGELTIVGTSTGRIPWPTGIRGQGRRSLILYADLAKAVRLESANAIRYWWGVGHAAVWKWRKTLKVPLSNVGTSRVRAAHIRGARGDAMRAAIDHQATTRRQKIAAAKRGKKRPAAVIAKMRAANLGKTLDAATRRKLSEVHRRLGTRPPWLKPAWSAEDDVLVRTLPASEVVTRTGRSLSAVYSRRSELGINNGRTTRHGREGVK